jgi:hypothetical protein
MCLDCQEEQTVKTREELRAIADEMENLFNVYVVWSYDGPIMTTVLQFEDSDIQRQAMEQWSPQDYVVQAFDAEFGCDEPNAIGNGEPYELAAIFTAKELHWIY